MACWRVEDVLAEELQLDKKTSRDLVSLIEKEQCTLPFIARYRKQVTNNMAVEKLRQVFETLSYLKEIHKKIETTIVKIEKTGELTESVKASLAQSRSIEELKAIIAPIKSSKGKKTLAARATALGLDSQAKQILEGKWTDLNLLSCDSNGKELSQSEVKDGIENVIADIIAKDSDILSNIKLFFSNSNVRLTSSKKPEKKTDKSPDKKQKSKMQKYETYFDFNAPVKLLKPYQVLAINRAESLKILSVKLHVPDTVEQHFMSLCRKKWCYIRSEHCDLFESAIKDSYKRLVLPLLTRQCRTSLRKDAEYSSVEIFGKNLKDLLLQPPCPQTIMGIDPGFTNGCKVAVIDSSGAVKETAVLYLNNNKNDSEKHKLAKIVNNHLCSILALGNGTACRETEAVLLSCISANIFSPVDVKYSIVNEDGSSIYSVSELAEKELPTLDQNIRSAVSIARRLQDPLVELVKIDPRHLGVGMYQHDVPENKLKARLDSVLMECVSFVGVDVNTASEHILSHISGLNSVKAKAIVAERKRIGGFICREQLLNIKGLGEKSYEQCAGFITVRSSPASKEMIAVTPKGVRGSKKAKLSFTRNPLDQTMVHPYSYGIALSLLERMDICTSDIGEPRTIAHIKKWKAGVSMEALYKALSTDEGTLSIIFEALEQQLNYDLRDKLSKPLFQSSKTSIENLSVGDLLTGAVRNVTDFGSFVDVGVHKDGLIHISNLNGQSLSIGSCVKVKVLSVDISKGRIGLKLVSVL